jgi:pyrroline-5-carboxylate reductase
MGAIGFVGTGRITEAMVRGLKRSALADRPILLSPRSVEVGARLALLPRVTVAASNQAVLDGAGLVILAVRPQIAAEVLQGLRFRQDHQVISLIAGLDHGLIGQMTGVSSVCRAIPLPFVETCQDATPVFPPHPEALARFYADGEARPGASAGGWGR